MSDYTLCRDAQSGAIASQVMLEETGAAIEDAPNFLARGCGALEIDPAMLPGRERFHARNRIPGALCRAVTRLPG